MRTLFLLSSIFIVQLVYAQPLIEFQKCYGGSQDEYANSVILNSGGYVIVGGSYSSDGQVTGLHGSLQDFWIVNSDSSGNLISERCFGGTGDDWAFSVIPGWDGGTVTCGYTNSSDGDVVGNHGATDVWLIKLDTIGNLQWKRCYGGSNFDVPYCIIQTFDRGYVISGHSMSIDGDVPGNNNPNPTPSGASSDVWVIKLDSSGTILWSKNYGGPGDDWALSIVQTYDSGFAFLGWTNQSGGDITGYHSARDYWLGRIDQNGNFLWGNCFGGSHMDQGYSLKQTPDSGFILVGSTGSSDGDISFNHNPPSGDIWIVKTDDTGYLEWEKSIGGTQNDKGSSVLVLNDSSYLVSAEVLSTDGDVVGNHGVFDYFLAKISIQGQLEWGKCFGGSGDDSNTGMIESGSNSWLLVGNSASNDGDVSGNHGIEDHWIIKLNDYQVSIPSPTTNPVLEIYPNPFFNQFKIRSNNKLKGQIFISNTLGQNLFSKDIELIESIDMSTFPDGFYFLEYIYGNDRVTKKVVKMN